MKKKHTKTSKQLGNPLAVTKVASKVVGASQATRQVAKSNPGFFTFLGFGVLGLMGYSLFKRMSSDAKAQIQKGRETDFSNNYDNAKLTDKKGVVFNPKEIASKYKQAIDGAGTGEQKLMDLARVSKDGRWKSISEQYKYLTGSTLINDLQGDLDTDEYTTFLNIQKSPTWYAIGEYVYPKKNTVKAITSARKIVEANVYWNVGSLGKVMSVQRGLLNGKQTEFYQTEDYPDYWIWVDHLYTKYDRLG